MNLGSRLDDCLACKIFCGHRQNLRPRPDHNCIIMPEATDAPFVETRFRRIDFALQEWPGIEGHVFRIFMTVETHAVTCTVTNERSHARLLEHLPRCLVDPAHRLAGDRGLTRSEEHT